MTLEIGVFAGSHRSRATGSGLLERQRSRIDRAVAAERKDGARLSFRIRAVVMAIVGCYLLTYGLEPRQFVNFAGLIGLCLTSWVQYRVTGGRWDRSLVIGVLPILDVLILVGVYFIAAEWDVPRIVVDDDRGFSWFVLLLTMQGLAYRPWLAALTGLVTAIGWLAVFFWMLNYPGAYGSLPDLDPDVDPLQQIIRSLYDPLFINTEAWVREAVIAVLCGGILAVAVQRSRGMLSRALQAERSRANLARYFSPSMVDELSVRDQPFDKPREALVGILFADIVGFTQIAEPMEPTEVISLLREFHGRVARIVFESEGTLDKFIGDCVMATFGTPTSKPTDATRTIACCLAIASEIEDWNGVRARAGLAPVRIGIGAHFGPVVTGDIGDERRLEFAVLGDTVNVASRLEGLTRTLGATALISDALVKAAQREGGHNLGTFRQIGPQRLRNREGLVGVWAYP